MDVDLLTDCSLSDPWHYTNLVWCRMPLILALRR